MGVLKARVGGAWETIVTGSDEVAIAAADPGAGYELWYDTSDPGVSYPAMPRGLIGYAVGNGAGDLTGFDTTDRDVTGITVTWTASPTRIYRTTATVVFTGASQACIQRLHIADASGVAVNGLRFNPGAAGEQFGASLVHIETGLSGSQTRKMRVSANGGTFNVANSATGGARLPLIVVEDIGGT
jgi:hypothetical protein